MSVITDLKKHILADGFHVVVDLDKSQGSWIVDKETGKRYLDCYSQFASQALGWNYTPLLERADYINKVALHKVANSDMYTETYRDFVQTFTDITLQFDHHFFIDGGALAVENALKAAFDWKMQVSPENQWHDGDDFKVIHLKESFHGRSGYTMSLTNTGELKTKWFPKFNWPRFVNPKIVDPIEDTIQQEALTLEAMEDYLKKGGNVAAVIFEPIQGEGGDNHFRPEFFKAIRELTLKYKAMFILDEVQTGMGLTGKWWAHNHFGIVPDMICFGKKAQVCGFCSTNRIDEAPENVFKVSGRINSTWGGNLTDMARSKVTIDIIRECGLVHNAATTGQYFLEQLKTLPEVSNVRGRGFMLAVDLPTSERRDEVMAKLQENMMAIKGGDRSIRFRPVLSFDIENVDQAITFLKKALS